MAPRGPPWELPNLLDYRAALVKAVREGPRALTELNLKTIWDYRPTAALMNFLNSDPNVGGDEDWQMVRPLGEGGFGHVGLWQVVRDDGSVADEIAIKQGHRIPGYDFDPNDHRGLAKEAVLQHQVNSRNCENIVHLRRFKFYQGEQKYRFFLEYCPYGDLRRLRVRYRAKASRIPELFAWHLFHSLAQAISAMQGPWSHFITGEAYPKDYHMLHMDLKHDNVFLGYERPSNEAQDETFLASNYPTIKVGDFGLAVITGPEDADNPACLWATGTQDYMPPEQRHFGIKWQNPPNHGQRLRRSDAEGNRVPFQHTEKRTPGDDVETWSAPCTAAQQAGFTFSSEQNVWGVGKIVMDMLTLGEPSELDRIFDAITEEYYTKATPQRVPYFDRAEFPEYSPRLLDLVEQCLRFEKVLRPTPAALVALTDTGLKEALQRLQAPEMDTEQAVTPGSRLYFKENDINHMPWGDLNLPYNHGEWNRLLTSGFQDTAWEPLIPDSAFRDKAMQVEPGAVQTPQRLRPRPFRFDNGQLATPWTLDDSGRIVFEGKDKALGSQSTEVHAHMPYCIGECGDRCTDAATALQQQQKQHHEAQMQASVPSQQQQQQQRQPAPAPAPAPAPGNLVPPVQQIPPPIQQSPPVIQSFPPPIRQASPASHKIPPLIQKSSAPPFPTQPGPARTAKDYQKLRIQDLEEDLRGHRGVDLATVTGPSTYKTNLIARAMQEDHNRNFGRGPVRWKSVTITRAGRRRKRPARR